MLNYQRVIIAPKSRVMAWINSWPSGFFLVWTRKTDPKICVSMELRFCFSIDMSWLLRMLCLHAELCWSEPWYPSEHQKNPLFCDGYWSTLIPPSMVSQVLNHPHMITFLDIPFTQTNKNHHAYSFPIESHDMDRKNGQKPSCSPYKITILWHFNKGYLMVSDGIRWSQHFRPGLKSLQATAVVGHESSACGYDLRPCVTVVETCGDLWNFCGVPGPPRWVSWQLALWFHDVLW